MKFAKILEDESVPEWRRAYLNYRGLKMKLKAVEKQRLAEVNASTWVDRNDMSHTNGTALPPPPSPGQGGMRHRQTASVPRQNTAPAFVGDRMPHQEASFLKSDLIRKLSTRLKHKTHEPGEPASQLQDAHQANTLFDKVLQHASDKERAFFAMLDNEMDKVATFYDDKEVEAKAQLEALALQIPLIRDFGHQVEELEREENSANKNSTNPWTWIQTRVLRRPPSTNNKLMARLPPSVVANDPHHMNYQIARNRLKKAIMESYRQLVFLRSYKTLNKTAVQKILKKFDKIAGWKASPLYLEKARRCSWWTSDDIDILMDKTEAIFVDTFADGDRHRGMKKLRVHDENEDCTGTASRVGFYLGLALAFIVRALQLALDPQTHVSMPDYIYHLQIYGSVAILLFFCLGVSVDMAIWNHARISYKFIFELEGQTLQCAQYAELPALMTLLMGIIMYLDFSQSLSPSVSSERYPALLIIILVVVLGCPFQVLYAKARRWFVRVLGRIFCSYWFPVEFRDFFIADELNSLAYSFWTMGYFACVYWWSWSDLDARCRVEFWWVSPILASLPPWWRFLQCIRRFQDSNELVHLWNAGKYTTSIMAAIATGARRIYPNTLMDVTWILSCVLNSSYTSVWDLKMDWGILQIQSPHPFLRDQLVFHPVVYYIAAPINVILRFAWAINLPSLAPVEEARLLAFIAACAEAIRRLQWNVFRLENEHINNCGNYRAIKEIPLPFAFMKGTVRDEEGGGADGAIQLPVTPSSPNAFIPRRSATIAVLPSRKLEYGSYFGRRDFENRCVVEDSDSDINKRRLIRYPSVVNTVLERMRLEHRSNQLDDTAQASESNVQEGSSSTASVHSSSSRVDETTLTPTH